MSLKAFHIFFIALAMLMSFSVGAWGIAAYSDRGVGSYLAMAIVCFIVGLMLIVYGIGFLRKLRHESFL